MKKNLGHADPKDVELMKKAFQLPDVVLAVIERAAALLQKPAKPSPIDNHSIASNNIAWMSLSVDNPYAQMGGFYLMACLHRSGGNRQQALRCLDAASNVELTGPIVDAASSESHAEFVFQMQDKIELLAEDLEPPKDHQFCAVPRML